MLTIIKPRVHVDRVFVFMLERSFLQEFDVFGRHCLFNRLSRVVQILLAIDPHCLIRVLFERSFPANNRTQPDVADAVKKVEHHLFVITT